MSGIPVPESGDRTPVISQRALKNRLKPDTQLALIRAAHRTLDPEKIGDLIVEHALRWFDVRSVAVAGADGRTASFSSWRGEGSGADSRTPRMRSPAGSCAPGVTSPAPICAATNAITGGAAGSAGGSRCSGAARPSAPSSCSTVRPIGRPPELSPALAELLMAVLEGPAVALDNALMLRRAEALSVTDDLTQLYNSRYLNQALRREAKRASRSNRPLSLLFLDLDGFKRVNDTHGHLAGSRALVEAAAAHSRLRP